MNKKYISVAAAVFFAALLGSCASKPVPYEVPDYSDEAFRARELERIRADIPEKPVYALWRAHMLVSSDEADQGARGLFGEIEQTLFSLLNKAVTAKNAADVRRLYDSLAAVSSPLLSNSGFNRDAELSKIRNARGVTQSVPGAKTSIRAAELIRGTVTVWVDLGLRVERGMGYADRVIGSGFFIDKAGYLITNYHVISALVDPKYEGFARLYIRLADDPDTRIPARVVGWDPALDIALLKTEAPVPYVFSLGSSAELEVGNRVYVIGSPVGLDRTLTSGIVSATDRKLLALGDVIQIDAAVNSGNSGGPVFDEYGTVLGIVFAGIKPYEGLNFAIPVEYLKQKLDALYAGGKAEHGWIGAYGRTRREGYNTPAGVEVFYLMPGGTGMQAGLAVGDVITSLDGKTVTTMEEYKNLLVELPPNTIITLGVIPGGGEGAETKKLTVCLENRPENPGYEIYQRDILGNALLPIFGMKLTPVAENGKRFTVESLIKAGNADESGFSELDPVEVTRTRFTEEKDAMQVELYTKKRKNGYLDVFISLVAALDDPYYF